MLGERAYVVRYWQDGTRIAVQVAAGDGRALAPAGRSVRVDPPGGASLVTDAGFWSGLAADEARDLCRIAANIFAELSVSEPGSEALAGAYALEFVIIAARIATRSGRHRGAAGNWVEPDGVWSIDDAIRYIELHYSDSFGLDWFVARCAMNVTDFSRRFKERAGCPLFEFINRQRVARACALLKSSDLSIIDIAEAVGYNNLSFFNRYFLRITGLSPRAYRAGSAR